MKAAEKPGRIVVPSFWRCTCGYVTGVHRVNCCKCGDHRAACEKKVKK